MTGISARARRNTNVVLGPVDPIPLDHPSYTQQAGR